MTFNYITKQDETWASVAWKMYKSLRIEELIKANPKVPIDPVFPVGTVLLIPILKTKVKSTPPWK